MNLCVEIQSQEQPQQQQTSTTDPFSLQKPSTNAILGDPPALKARPRPRYPKKTPSPRNWTEAENKRYAGFLQQNQHLFELSPQQRKQVKLNVLMSRKVKSRTPVQCHSHHQNMVSKLGGIKEIISHYFPLTEPDFCLKLQGTKQSASSFKVAPLLQDSPSRSKEEHLKPENSIDFNLILGLFSPRIPSVDQESSAYQELNWLSQ